MSNEQSDDQEPAQPVPTQINTGGGAVFEQDVDTGGGDLIGRDQNITIEGDEKVASGALGKLRKAIVGRDQNVFIRIGSLKLPIWLAAIVAICALTVVVLVGWYIRRMTPDLLRMTGRLSIAIADFGVQDNRGGIQDSPDGALLSNWLARRLEDALPKSDHGILVFEIWQDEFNKPPSNPSFNTITSADQAEKLLADDNIAAKMVVFGHLDRKPGPANLTLNFVYKDLQIAKEPDGDMGRQRIGEPIPISAQYSEIPFDDPLFIRSQAIVGLARGLAQEFAGNYQEALDFYNLLDQQLPLSRWQKGREVLYYFAGRSAFQLRQLALAESLFQQAKTQRADYVSAFVGLGNVEYERVQLYLLKEQKVEDAMITTCGGNQLAEYQLAAQEREALPASLSEAIITTTQSIEFYQQAVSASDTYEWTPAKPITRYLLANGIRFRGDLYWLDNQLELAEADLQQSQSLLQAVIEPFVTIQEPGYAAWSWHGLGQAQRTLAQIARERGENDLAFAAFTDAATSFGRCQEFKEQPDARGDTQYQTHAACYCAWWQQKVEQEGEAIPQEEKGVVG